MQTFAPKQNQTKKPASSDLARSHTATPGHHRADRMLHLQHTIGNQALLRMAETHPEELKARLAGTPSPRVGHDFSRIPIHPPAAGVIQTKLAINKPGDEYEQEADRVAEQVMRMPEPQLQRKCACGGTCPKCQADKLAQGHERLQTKRIGSGDLGQTAVPPIVHEVLRSPGQPLDAATRAFMEPRFKHDFSQVRIHTDETAGRSALAIAAKAYTVGHHLVFRPGRYAPETWDGRRLLAHELTHVVQQPGSEVVARQIDPSKPSKTPTTSKTHFTPGVSHHHQPSGRWKDVQSNPNSDSVIGGFCSHFSPSHVLEIAQATALYGNPIAVGHLKWYLAGSGADFIEDDNLELMLRTDAGVQAKITGIVPSGKTKGIFAGHVAITQDNYSSDEFKNSFGEIDRLDFEIDFAAGTMHAWFQDRYEWHPVYPFYPKEQGDYVRPTNCVHAAAVEMKSEGAKDYWMKGEMPFKVIPPAASYTTPPTPPSAVVL